MSGSPVAVLLSVLLAGFLRASSAAQEVIAMEQQLQRVAFRNSGTTHKADRYSWQLIEPTGGQTFYCERPTTHSIVCNCRVSHAAMLPIVSQLPAWADTLGFGVLQTWNHRTYQRCTMCGRSGRARRATQIAVAATNFSCRLGRHQHRHHRPPARSCLRPTPTISLATTRAVSRSCPVGRLSVL